MTFFDNFSGHVTNEMLNGAYGDAGRTFKTLAEAEAYKNKNGGMITRLSNYHSSDVEAEFDLTQGGKKRFKGIKIADGAKRHCTGYLVSKH